MRTLKNYIQTGFIATFLITVGVFTFVLSIGGLFKLTDLVTRGVAPGPIVLVFLSGIPSALSFAIPVSCITSSLLLFHRLSADNEITAMRACGISLRQVTGWLLPIALLLTIICVYIQSELEPQTQQLRRTAMNQLNATTLSDLIDEGQTMQLMTGVSLYVDRKRGKVLENIRIFDAREAGRMRTIQAKRGFITTSDGSNDLLLLIEDVMIDPFSFDRPGVAYCGKWRLPLTGARRTAVYQKRDIDRTLPALYLRGKRLMQEADAAIRDAEPVPVTEDRLAAHTRMREDAMRTLVTFHRRLVLAVSPVCFMLFGIPMGIRPHRRDTSKGIGLSLLVVFVFFMSSTLSRQLAGYPDLHPDLLTWIPTILLLLIDVFLIWHLD